jgi:hypothetical protein
MSSAVGAYVHACYSQVLAKSATRKKWGQIGSLGWIPMIQSPFYSSCAALQYETGTKFFHQAVPEIHAIEKLKISVQPRGQKTTEPEADITILCTSVPCKRKLEHDRLPRDHTSNNNNNNNN